jgi:hypothetical protein
LGHNYPNPFNPQTTIAVALPQAGQLKLAVYDVRGQLVEMIADRHLPAGEYKFVWNPKVSISSGLYFYKLEVSGKFEQTKKLLYLK